MNKTHRISVALITHNRSQQLQRCLSSLTRQRRRPDEVVIVNNRSSDSTEQIVRSFMRLLPITYQYSSKAGYLINRNIALKIARHNTIAWIDDDCIATPTWLEEIEKSLSLGLYFFQGVDLDDKKNIFSYAQNLRTEEFRRFSKYLYKETIDVPLQIARSIYHTSRPFSLQVINGIDHRTFIYRKQILNKLPYWFNEHLPPYFTADEWDLLRRIRNAGYKVILNPRIRVIHHGRTSFWTFIKRHIEYGRSEGIKEWLDASRRRKLVMLKKQIIDQKILQFYSTRRILFKIDIKLMQGVLKDKNFRSSQKFAIITLFLLAKVVRYTGKKVEQMTNPLLWSTSQNKFLTSINVN